MGYIVKSSNPEDSGYTAEFWDCVKRAKESGYREDIAKAWCGYLYG